MAYIIGTIVGLIVGAWLIVSAFHIAWTVIGWVLVVASIATLVMYFMRQRKEHHGSIAGT